MNSSYIAGFVDGEGCIGFSKARSVYYPRAMIVNTNLDLLNDIKTIYGGRIAQFNRTNPKWKNGYQLTISNRMCVDFLDDIADDLILKYEQALLVFAWDEIRPGKGGRWTDETFDAMSMILAQSKWLNERGVNGQTTISPIDIELIWPSK
jgi:hypothetical protein